MGQHAHELVFVVDPAHNGLRIDSFLASRLRNHAPEKLLRLVSAGLATVNDGPCLPDRRVFRGEEVRVRLAEPPQPFYEPEQIPLVVLYEDPWLLAVNKPAGLIAHPVGPVSDGTLANAAQRLVDGQTRLPALLRPGLVHRLDRETSGVVVVAKDHVAHADLTWQFGRSAVAKIYIALVRGRVAERAGTIELPIGRRHGSLLMSAEPDAADPRKAATEFRVIERFRSTTLLELRPITGRKHQIRVHLAAIGHPVVGDSYYPYSTDGDGRGRGSGRHALHAAAISVRHPVTNAPFRITAPVPGDFWETLAAPM